MPMPALTAAPLCEEDWVEDWVRFEASVLGDKVG